MARNPDHLKYRNGPVRNPRLTGENETGNWYENSAEARDINTYFAAGGVPNNPINYASFHPQASSFAQDVSGKGGLPDSFGRRNPYGDGEQIVVGARPVKTRPDQWGKNWREPPAAATDGENQPGTAGYGFPDGMNPLARFDAEDGNQRPLGMSTGISPMGSGPQRNVPRRKRA